MSDRTRWHAPVAMSMWWPVVLLATLCVMLAACGGVPPTTRTPVAPTIADGPVATTLGASPTPTFDPTPAPGSTHPPTPSVDPSVLTLESIGANDDLPVDRLLTSDRFGIPVTFWVEGYDDQTGKRASDWCAPLTSRREIALRTKFACTNGVSIILPRAIDCGAGPTPTTSGDLVARLRAKPALHARDRGAVAGNALFIDGDPFAAPVHGHIIDIDAGAPESSKLDPDGCSIRADHTDIVVRRDHPMRIIAVDTADGLVLIVGVDHSHHLGKAVGPPGDVGLGMLHDIQFGSPAS